MIVWGTIRKVKVRSPHNRIVWMIGNRMVNLIEHEHADFTHEDKSVMRNIE